MFKYLLLIFIVGILLDLIGTTSATIGLDIGSKKVCKTGEALFKIGEFFQIASKVLLVIILILKIMKNLL